MEEIIKIINNIKGESSRNGKEALLHKYKDNKTFVDILKFVYDPFIVTGISSKKLNKRINTVYRTIIPGDITKLMEYLKNNNTGKDGDIYVVQQFINEHEEFKGFITEIVCKSLKIGCTEKTINKVLGKNTIPSFSVMLAESYAKKSDKVKGDFTLTLKLDGNRLVAIKEDNHVKFFSRKGQLIEGLFQLEKEFLLLPDGYVYDGEVLLRNDDNLPSDELFRATQRVIRKDGSKENVIFYMFDILPLAEFKNGKSKLTYEQRRKQLDSLKTSLEVTLSEYIDVLPALYQGNDASKIHEYLKMVVDQGQEGVMVNLNNGYYETKRTTSLLKVKEFHSAELECIGIEEGTGKYKGKLGRINVKFKDNICGVGSGFTDEQREYYWNNQNEIVGEIIEVQFFEESKDEKTNLPSLRFPVFKTVRFDKNVEDVNID